MLITVWVISVLKSRVCKAMETCIALCLKVLCAAVLVPLLHPDAQVTSSETVSIEALCSSDSAGLRWTAHTNTTEEVFSVQVAFSCNTTLNVEITTDECFVNDSKIIVEQLTEPYLTHTIGRRLEAGTVCTFEVIMFNRYDRLLDTVSSSCTVNEAAVLLPAQCAIAKDTQQCQCSCSPGFTEHARSDSYFECGAEEPTVMQEGTASTTQESMRSSTQESVTPSTESATTESASASTTESASTTGPSYQIASSSTVTVEAMCSSNNAGLKWTVRGGYTISVGFSCTSSSAEITMDKCFKKDRTAFITPQLVEPFKTHIIGTELEPGTACTFHATTRDFRDRTMDTVSASCTVSSSAASLPAQCAVTEDTQQCQCSCSPGFLESTGPNPYFECERVETSTSLMPVATSTYATELPTETPSLKPVGPSQTVLELSTATIPHLITTSPPTMELLVTPSPKIELSTATPSLVPVVTPEPTVGPFSALPSQETTPIPNPPVLPLEMLPMLLIFVVPITIITALLICIGAVVHRKNKMKRLHTQMALPFEMLKFEKIDPNFNPVKIEKMKLESSSIHSVFHFLSPISETQETSEENSNYDSTDESTPDDPITHSGKEEDLATYSSSDSSGYATEPIGRDVVEMVDYYLSSTCDSSSQESINSLPEQENLANQSSLSTESLATEQKFANYTLLTRETPANYTYPITEVSFDFPQEM